MKKRILFILTIIFLLCSTLSAQQLKSKTKAALLSSLLPGAGEFYSKNNTSALISLASETILWLGYFGFLQEADWAERDYKIYASAYSGSNIANGSAQYYKDLQHYFSSTEYNNNARIYARWRLGLTDSQLQSYDLEKWNQEDHDEFLYNNLYQGNEEWNWHSEDIWYRYGELRREKNKFKILAKFTIGAMIANRVISMIKAVRSTAKYNKNLTVKKDFSFHIDFNPKSEKITFALVKRF
ncbi:MAG: hypothetical protein U9R23_00465 [Candidatus Cloacimonadota bacterium]|nr:hypothetical protein [Candidatus Cloacimonadota bacterium]